MSGTEDILGHVFSGGESGVGGWVDGIGFFLYVILFLLIALPSIFGIVWLMLNFFSYKHKVIIFEKSTDGVRVKFDRARKVIKNNVIKFHLMKLKSTVLPPPDWGSKYFSGNNETLVLHKENGVFHFHVGYDSNVKELHTIPQEAVNVFTYETMDNILKYQKQDFWNKYGQLILNVAFIIVVFFFMTKLGKDLNTLSSALSSTANSLKEVMVSTCGSTILTP